jgi:hypothetical protein
MDKFFVFEVFAMIIVPGWYRRFKTSLNMLLVLGPKEPLH